MAQSNDLPKGWICHIQPVGKWADQGNLGFRSAFFLAPSLVVGAGQKKEVLVMNTTTYMIGGLLLIILGAVGLYHIRDAPGLAFFATIALVGGFAMIGKARNIF
jgi:hypothetical protein